MRATSKDLFNFYCIQNHANNFLDMGLNYVEATFSSGTTIIRLDTTDILFAPLPLGWNR